MDWTVIIASIIAAAGGYAGARVSSNKQIAVFQAVVTERLDHIDSRLDKQETRLDQHNHLNERLMRVEVKLEEREK